MPRNILLKLIVKALCACVCYSQPPAATVAGQPLGSRLAWTLPTNCSPSAAVAAPPTRLPLGPSAASIKVVRARREGEWTSSALYSPDCTSFYGFWKNSLDSMSITSPSWPSTGEVSEAALVRDILYVFQGIDGKFIKMSAQDNCYKIDSKVPARVYVPVKLLIEIWVQ